MANGRDIDAEIRRIREIDPTADVSKLLKERRAKIEASPEFTRLYGGKALEEYEKEFATPIDPEVARLKGQLTQQQERYTGLERRLAQRQNIEEMQRRLTQQQERARVSGLRKAREAGLSALMGEEREIAPTFAGARRGVRATSALGAQQFAQFLAQRGLTRAGGAALGETQRLGALQAGLGALGRQETQALGDIARRRTGIETGFATDVEAARAGIQAESLQRQLAQQEAERQRELQVAGITGQFRGAPTLAGQELGLAQQRQVFGQQMDVAQLNEQLRQFDATLDQRARQFEAEFNLDVRQQSFNETQDRINAGIRQGQLTVQQGNALLAKKRFEVEQDPNSLDNQLKRAQISDVEAVTAGRLAGPIPGEEPLTPGAYKTSPDFAKDLSRIINATPEEREVLRQQLQQNAQAFITKYGIDGYQALINETTRF